MTTLDRSLSSCTVRAVVLVSLIVFWSWIDDSQTKTLAWVQPRTSPQRKFQHDAKPITCCYLFTQPSNAKNSQTFRRKTAYEKLVGTDLPWIFELTGDDDDESSSLTTPKLSIRLMEFSDVDSIVTMNVQEYGSGPAYFPWSNLSLMEAWIDRQYIRWLVDITCRIKLFNYLMDDDSSFTASTAFVNDHAILVGVINDQVIGMIEVSLQPQNPRVTPSPIPIPINLKRVLAVATTRSSLLVGWITNLLIFPQYRGYGYAKLLVAASEQMAKSCWNCTSIHLHCDADPVSGRVPQKLYSTLGYRSPKEPSVTTSTSSSDMGIAPYVVEIEGVPLLYLRKDL